MGDPLDSPVIADVDPGGDAVWRRPVPPVLRSSVLRMCGFEDTGAALARQREVPFVGVPIILTFGAPYRLSGAENPDLPVYRRAHFVAGPHATYTTTESTGAGWSIQIDLTASGAFMVLGMPQGELTNRIATFDGVVGPPGRRLLTDLEQAATWNERFGLVERFLLDRQAAGPRPDHAVLWSLRQLQASSGQARIGPLARAWAMSHRHFTARFSEQIGLSPKLAARQIRFTSARALLLGSDQSLAGIAAQLGYADQAHLTREFREFAGIPPRRFRSARKDNPNPRR